MLNPGELQPELQPERRDPGSGISQCPAGEQCMPPAPDHTAGAHPRFPDRTDERHPVRSWPLLVLALPAAVTIWSGWVGIGEMTGFGLVHPLPGIWNSFHLNTAVTLPVGVEAYAAYALRAWLSELASVSYRTRRFARRSAIGSLLLGMAGQVAYHLLSQARTAHAPWGITTAVSCLPVLVLGMGAALAHLLRADALQAAARHQPARPDPLDPDDRPDVIAHDPTGAVLLAKAEPVARRLAAAGQRISRRTLRASGVHGSNAHLGALARILRSRPADTTT
jgi:hypothetical protein